MRINTFWNLLGTFGVALAGGLLGASLLSPQAPEAGPVAISGANNAIVGTYGVGGVLTASGNLWQYRPDKKGWVTLDESFKLEDEATSVQPLPVPTERIAHIETFGFLVDRDNTCWLYDIEAKAWKNIGAPPLK